MRLYEDLQEEIISRFQDVLDTYELLVDKCLDFKSACDDEKDLEFDAEYLNDFCSEEFKKKLESTKKSILDKYYPVETGEDEDDYTKAGELYKDSLNKREQVFRN